jgi:hypothetical protein
MAIKIKKYTVALCTYGKKFVLITNRENIRNFVAWRHQLIRNVAHFEDVTWVLYFYGHQPVRRVSATISNSTSVGHIVELQTMFTQYRSFRTTVCVQNEPNDSEVIFVLSSSQGSQFPCWNDYLTSLKIFKRVADKWNQHIYWHVCWKKKPAWDDFSPITAKVRP